MGLYVTQGILLLLKGVALLGDNAFVSVGQGICKLAKVCSSVVLYYFGLHTC